MIPCRDCICVPICRQKTYYGIMSECSLIRLYIPEACYARRRSIRKVEELEWVLNPTEWAFTYNHEYKEEYAGIKLIVPKTDLPPYKRENI